MSELPLSLRDLAADSVAQLRAAVVDYKRVCYANSLGLESMVLTDLIFEQVPQIGMFSIDTGRLFPETLDLIVRIEARYGRPLRIFYPETDELEGWVRKNGINGFRNSVEQRRGCCWVRKVEPFR